MTPTFHRFLPTHQGGGRQVVADGHGWDAGPVRRPASLAHLGRGVRIGEQPGLEAAPSRTDGSCKGTPVSAAIPPGLAEQLAFLVALRPVPIARTVLPALAARSLRQGPVVATARVPVRSGATGVAS